MVSNPVSSADMRKMIKRDGARVIDVRSIPEIEKDGFVKNMVNIDFGGNFASWAGTILSPKGFYIVYGPEDKAKESIKRLLRIGYVNIGGYCSDNIS